jgi:hypothetical protein
VPHWWSEVPAACGAAQATGNGTRLDNEFGYPCDVLLACAEQAKGNRFGAFVTCATLIFAMIGCLTRIRKRADSNIQKIFGTFPDLFGIITLGASLLGFGAQCTSKMVAGEGESGAGFLVYCFCWLAAVVRVSIHIVMPVPGAGVSCACALGDRSRLFPSGWLVLGDQLEQLVRFRVDGPAVAVSSPPNSSRYRC